ncbi:D-alanine--D-alanine ligase family protein [Bosea sp. (in: a-proteobacteria)]|uniref:D-alanine--D-alanine ligase family protein n=1 Tax=Bosea sp. (in: a-proteobacteria) TaxID=1871050 RepID=UPI002631988F|nr:D-alanine--D-alanine ligase family protein [Bosea sp. (in: a-proteobacteria)]MCO5092593.1 D-alanine--D-alanine ligase [Bosea sp. (in: a-proteobacteria)]
MNRKTRVAVLYGGKSGEHEVSLKSAASVLRHIDRERFEPVPVSIDKQGRWQCHELRRIDAASGDSLPILADSPAIRLEPRGRRTAILPTEATAPAIEPVDVVFPVIHGPLCEDGAVQGLLELAGAAYVGSGVLASAIGMHKDIAKRLAGLAGLPIAPYLALSRRDWRRSPAGAAEAARERLTLPVFVKPCNMGSSVGVHKVKRWEDLDGALTDAFQYDTEVLVEQGIDAREIEVAVIDGDPPVASVASELNAGPQHEFYSYEAKYIDQDGASIDLPAKLDAGEMARVRQLAVDAFVALECSGLARVDFFLDRKSGAFFFNEINTLPGFTAISMYPKMMEASGLPYPALITRLIELARERHAERAALKTDYAG